MVTKLIPDVYGHPSIRCRTQQRSVVMQVSKRPQSSQKANTSFHTHITWVVNYLKCTSINKNSVARTMTTKMRVKAYSYSFPVRSCHIH